MKDLSERWYNFTRRGPGGFPLTSVVFCPTQFSLRDFAVGDTIVTANLETSAPIPNEWWGAIKELCKILF